jgi:DNA-directed RNA polymerase specialized sigma24 family protein
MPYDEMSDETLLERIGRCDRTALAALYDRYAAAALAVATLVTGQRAAAEAVVEQLFWAVWRGEIAAGGRIRHHLMLGARQLARGRVAFPLGG